jgi:hypothetical protein
MNNMELLTLGGSILLAIWAISIIVFLGMLAYHMLDDMDD